ncbi:MAG: hypothetical protein V3T30_03165, partial [Thermodesulfobacteriota bacterium]
RERTTKSDNIVDPPKGVKRDIEKYYSIQNHFPDIYGINNFGTPESETSARKAQARQLKAYLLFFEQIMANSLSSLNEISSLFSLDKDLKSSYFHQLLGNDSVAGIEGLYEDKRGSVKSLIGEIVKKYDNYGDRRGRVLDYLLQLYGEKFSQNSLKHFSYCIDPDEKEGELIQNKINFLADIENLSMYRVAGFNYLNSSLESDNISNLQKKVSILLGFKHKGGRSLVEVFVKKNILLVTGDAKVKRPLSKYHRSFDEDMKVVRDFVLRSAASLDSFEIRKDPKGSGYKISIRLEGDDIRVYPETFSGISSATVKARELRDEYLKLNIDSEGLHIVEHILLRTRASEKSVSLHDDPLAFRISVIFPSWTKRFHNPEFRKLAEETVILNCPAHIHPYFYWLNFEDMMEFEGRYKVWLDKKCQVDQDPRDLDRASRTLLEFLLIKKNNDDLRLSH